MIIYLFAFNYSIKLFITNKTEHVQNVNLKVNAIYLFIYYE
jgi:hypothetical protein